MTDHRFILSFCVLSALPPLSQPCLGLISISQTLKGKRKKAATHRASENKQLFARREGDAVRVSMNEDGAAEGGVGGAPSSSSELSPPSPSYSFHTCPGT